MATEVAFLLRWKRGQLLKHQEKHTKKGRWTWRRLEKLVGENCRHDLGSKSFDKIQKKWWLKICAEFVALVYVKTDLSKKYRLVSSSIYNANLFENMNLPVLFGMLFWHPIQQDLQTTPQKIPSQIFTYQNFVQNNSPNQNAARPAKPGRIRCINIPCHFSSISSKLLFPSHRSLMTLPLGLTTNVVFFGFRVDVFGGA